MFVVEVEYAWRPYPDLDERYERDTPEEAAQIFENEGVEAKPRLGETVEELASGLRLESLCTETGKKVVAYELVEAGVA